MPEARAFKKMIVRSSPRQGREDGSQGLSDSETPGTARKRVCILKGCELINDKSITENLSHPFRMRINIEWPTRG